MAWAQLFSRGRVTLASGRSFPSEGVARDSAGEGAVALTEPEAIEQFTDLYVRHHRQVYAYAASRAGRQLAEEVVSEVFLIAWRRLADVPAPAPPWRRCRTVTVNCSRWLPGRVCGRRKLLRWWGARHRLYGYGCTAPGGALCGP